MVVSKEREFFQEKKAIPVSEEFWNQCIKNTQDYKVSLKSCNIVQDQAPAWDSKKASENE